MTQTPPIRAEQVEAIYLAVEAHIQSTIAGRTNQALITNRLRSVIRAGLASIPASRGVGAEGRPANFSGWKGRLLDLTVEFDCIQVGPDPDKALSNAQAIVAEMLEGFDDVIETEAILAASPAPQPVQEQEPFGWWVSDNASEAYMTFERDEHTRRTRMRMLRGDWTETPLYASPPEQELTKVERVACRNFIADPCGSASCASCGKRRRDHHSLPGISP